MYMYVHTHMFVYYYYYFFLIFVVLLLFFHALRPFQSERPGRGSAYVLIAYYISFILMSFSLTLLGRPVRHVETCSFIKTQATLSPKRRRAADKVN